jgi:pilus assembly protein CpaE
MNITIITDSNFSGGARDIHLAFLASDIVKEFVREDQGLKTDLINLEYTDLIIIQNTGLIREDLPIIASLTEASLWPAVIYISEVLSSSELLELMRAGTRDVLTGPWILDELKSAIDRIRRRNKHLRPNSTGTILAFMSSKGGAGATFLAGNLGHILSSEFGCRTLIIDLHTQGGDAAFYLANESSGSSFAEIVEHESLDSMMLIAGSLKIESNFFLLEGPNDPEKGARITPAHIDNLITVASKEFDFIILDLPHALDGMTIRALDRSNLIYLITQPIMAYLRGLLTLLDLFDRLSYPENKVRLILNRLEENSLLSATKTEALIKRGLSSTISNDSKVAIESSNLGRPIATISSKSQICISLRKIASELTGVNIKSDVKPSWLKSFFAK